jgi:hypothetical protein
VNQPEPDQDSVRCHSGYTYAQRPVRFTYDCKDYVVKRIVMESNTPEGKRFLVSTEIGKYFVLTYLEALDSWQIVKHKES